MSQAIADQLDADPAKIVVVYETADPAEFSPARAGRFRASVGIPDDAPLVGAAGRIDSWKGFDVLLDAFERALATRPDLQLVVAGGPVNGKAELFEQLRTRAGALPGAHWLGARSDVPDLLADLDLFVLPSTEPEPYGLVVVEALASGAPVVVTDAGGPREIAAGATAGSARLVPPGDAGALAGAILSAVADAGVSTTAIRRARAPRREPEPDRFAALFRSVCRTRPGG